MSNMNKPVEAVTAIGHDVPDNTSDDVVLGEKSGTSRDVEDMKRMGKEQVFKVTPVPGHLARAVF